MQIVIKYMKEIENSCTQVLTKHGANATIQANKHEINTYFNLEASRLMQTAKPQSRGAG